MGRPLVVNGRERFAALLEKRAGDPSVGEFRGIAVQGDRLVLSFRRPWWDDRRRAWWRLLGASLGERFDQAVTFGAGVERLDCSVTLADFGPSWFETAFAFETLPDR